ncbi:ketoacyl-ACP synthase III [Paenibacillus sp. SC116]|uniref:ketoacyl-ACP synthase III n=1 Tax=Paenibacillus sp. SC116 TaxID=2968986 RepID=UPI00215A8BAD|nr:ketoacyl-ACP synthase III [Paenibacillus sp. SC116]MCR8845015.1 ketoacyl-ACP synthase III [Paenibacillus sp. SC116]
MAKLVSQARITSLGYYVPEQRLTNADMEQLVDTSHEWIVQRTGIVERRKSDEHQFTSDLSIRAVQNLIDRFQKQVDDVDFILVCTITPDYGFPSVAARVQAHFGISRCGTLDINAVCAGFAYGLHLANSLITSGLHNKVLVIGAETLTKITDYTDRATCILFGDGAGAALVERDAHNPSFISAVQGTKGEGGKHVYLSGLSQTIDGQPMNSPNKMWQNGREVYRWATTTVSEGIQELVQQADFSMEQVNWIVPHSANQRILESISERIDVPIDRFLSSIEYYGNTSTASIPLAIQVGLEQGKLQNGDHLVLFGFGGGLTYAGLLIQWNLDPETT